MKKLTLLFLGLILISCGKGDDSSSLEEIQNGEFVNSNPGIWLLDYTEADDNYSSSIYGTLTIESQSLSWDIFETYQDGYKDDTNNNADSRSFTWFNDQLLNDEIDIITNDSSTLKIRVSEEEYNGDIYVQIFTLKRVNSTLVFTVTDLGESGESIETILVKQ